eukprot:2053933-Amphidinium_carterae.1
MIRLHEAMICLTRCGIAIHVCLGPEGSLRALLDCSKQAGDLRLQHNCVSILRTNCSSSACQAVINKYNIGSQ